MEKVRGKAALIVLAASSSSAFSETVHVKYWGDVDLEPYVCTSTISSFVHRVCYYEQYSHVVVLLNETYYAYCRVDAETVGEWLSAESIGRFYSMEIRDSAVDEQFTCRR